MGEIAIHVDRLGKQFAIGTGRAYRYQTIQDALKNAALAPLRMFRKSATASIWALRNVSFEVKQGEVVGIIGRNGAGKSTLLKVLSRITEPTEGSATIHGRVASLLEVGTGFHPELTGRENIYLNGAILGMKRAEIVRKFDEIVAFAEVERFIETAVKHYSSGMYLRLAFAVAAHLEPEILLVDEVLAVGDAKFQRKCMDKMEDVSHKGRTVLFVSHNMPAVTRICPRTILLDEGGVLKDGPSHEVVGAYLSTGIGTTAERRWKPDKAPGNALARLASVRVLSDNGEVAVAADIRKAVGVEMEYEVLEGGHRIVPSFDFINEDGVCAFAAMDTTASAQRPREPGRYISAAWIPPNVLSEGTLIVGAGLSTADPRIVIYHERDAVAFQVVDTMSGDSARGDYAGPFPGVVRPMLRWVTTPDADARKPSIEVLRSGGDS